MGEKICLGFHACTDYELIWDVNVVNQIIRDFDIHDAELTLDMDVITERDVWVYSLAHMKAGMGGEIMPSDPTIVDQFAWHFNKNVTTGGTAARAATAISKIGFTSALEMCCFNHYIKEQMPKEISWFSAVGDDHDVIYPHVILSYHGNEHIHGNDIDFVTPRENRVMISRDIDSLNMVISQGFAPMIKDAEVFLLSCFSEVLDFEILKARMGETRQLLANLPKDALVVMEDGCYIQKDFRYFVHKELAPVIDIISMNEDELQEYIGKRIDILDPQTVKEAIEYVYEHVGVKTLIVHSAKWALSYGERAQEVKNALYGAVTMAATRFQYGDDFGIAEFRATKTMEDHEKNVTFCDQIADLTEGKVCCIPCKDLSFVKKPTVVGLGDFFVGGLLPGLLKENRNL